MRQVTIRPQDKTCVTIDQTERPRDLSCVTIDQTDIVHDIITVRSDIELTQDVDVLLYSWHALPTDYATPDRDSIILTCMDCRWIAQPFARRNYDYEHEEDKQADRLS